MRASAHAKINLSLEVIGARPDGYHEIVSVMQTVTLADEVEVGPSDVLKLQSNCADLESEHNLVLRAARLLQPAGQSSGASLRLTKEIPVAAGLGGGSSDGAVALVLLNRLWDLGLNCPRLLSLAERLGADVPFFLYGGTCLVEGKGERVTPLPSAPEAWYVLARPSVSVSTARIFQALPKAHWGDGETTRRLARALESGTQVVGTNTLQQTLFALYPEAEACFQALAARSPAPALVSGSGPTSFARFGGRPEALHAARDLREQGYWAMAVSGCNPKEETTPCA